MVKVLHIGEKGSLGGAESVFRNTVLALRTGRHMTHYVACKNAKDLPFKPDVVFEERSSLLSDIYSVRNFVALKRGLFKLRPDIVHLHHYGNLSPSIFHAIAIYKRDNPLVKVFFSVHTFEYVCSHAAAYDYKRDKRCIDCAQNRYKWKIFGRGCSRLGWLHSVGKGIRSLLTEALVKRGLIDQWITPSYFLKSIMSLRPDVDSTRISVLYNPISHVVVGPPLKKKEDQMIFFGRLSEEKNIDMLVRAFFQYRKRGGTYRLVIAGDGPVREQVAELIDTLDLNEHTEMTGFLDPPALQRLLQKSKVAILPSKCYESASMVVLESVIFGVMPVVAAHGGMKEMVEWLEGGLQFASDDESDLIAKMEMAVNGYEVWKQGQARMIDMLKSHALPEPYARKLNELYEMHLNRLFITL